MTTRRSFITLLGGHGSMAAAQQSAVPGIGGLTRQGP
jgi:hypothetical protein